MNHEIYMRRCIELARKAFGNTYPNPMVGSVIVHNGKIIGEGYHHQAGGPHAEVNAILSVKTPSLLPESTIYVSLEPCAHYGKTPPCALKIRETGFRKVVIGTLDSHDKVNGKGKHILEEAGIEVISGVLESECQRLNKRFFTFHQKKRPYIILKWAVSADGFMDKNNKPYPIGNSLTRQFVHQMRSEEHAILVGTRTALHDNPSLTTREITGRNPVRILIDRQLKVSENFNIFNSEAPTFVFNSVKNEDRRNIRFIKTDEDEDFLQGMIKKLYENDIQSVLVEGGRETLNSFVRKNLWDEAVVITNPGLFLENGTPAPDFDFTAEKTVRFRDNAVQFFRNKASV